jgi:osmotically-inducible protein OsmY
MVDDHQLRQNVLDELDFEPRIGSTNIGVGAHEGVITLSGFVSSYAEKLAAERAARRVKGVTAIAQEIEVRLPSDKKTADDEIAKRAVDVLNWRFGIPATHIGVKVEKGTVTLTGDVDWHFQRLDAEDAVRHLSGVVGVSNRIRLRSARPMADITAVKDKIQEALRRSAKVDASHISVNTEGGKVVLGGKVHAWFERDLAEQAAWSAPGVTEVQDCIQVEPWTP